MKFLIQIVSSFFKTSVNILFFIVSRYLLLNKLLMLKFVIQINHRIPFFIFYQKSFDNA